MELFVKDKKRRHDDVTGVFGWIRIVSLEQAEVNNSVGAVHLQLRENKNIFLIKFCKDRSLILISKL